MRIHEIIKDAKLTKEGLEYLSDLDERIKEENKHLLDEIQKLQDEVVDELRSERKKYLDRIAAYNKSWLNKLFSLRRKI